MRKYITIGLTEYAIEFDYRITAQACAETGPTYASGGEPASALEWEVSGPISLYFEKNTASRGQPPKYIDIPLEVPPWLDEELTAYLQEDTDGSIYEHILTDGADDDRN